MNRLILSTFALALAASPLFAADAPASADASAAPAPSAAPAKPAAKPKKSSASSSAGLSTEDDKTAYAYGFKVGMNLAPLGLSESEVKLLAQGLRDAAAGKTEKVNMAIYLPKVPDLIQKHVAAKAEVEKKKGAAYAEAFSKEPGVQPIEKGGFIKTLTEGKGEFPSADDSVKVNYRGTTIDGKEFDSSYKRHEPTEFPLKNVIPCWTNGVAMMKVGGKAKLVCPSDVAYGDQGHPPVIAGGATLVFEVELLAINKPDAPKEEAPRSEEPKPEASKKDEK